MDERWRWHAGLDVESTAILNALYRGEPVADEVRARLATLFRLTFVEAGDALAEAAGRPVSTWGSRFARTTRSR